MAVNFLRPFFLHKHTRSTSRDCRFALISHWSMKDIYRHHSWNCNCVETWNAPAWIGVCIAVQDRRRFAMNVDRSIAPASMKLNCIPFDLFPFFLLTMLIYWSRLVHLCLQCTPAGAQSHTQSPLPRCQWQCVDRTKCKVAMNVLQLCAVV